MTMAPHVEDLTKVIESLPSLISAISESPISGWIFVIASFVWLLAYVNKNISSITDMLERKQKRRLELIDSYISASGASAANSIKAIQDIRDALYFKVATGIYAEKRVRDAVTTHPPAKAVLRLVKGLLP